MCGVKTYFRADVMLIFASIAITGGSPAFDRRTFQRFLIRNAKAFAKRRDLDVQCRIRVEINFGPLVSEIAPRTVLARVEVRCRWQLGSSSFRSPAKFRRTEGGGSSQVTPKSPSSSELARMGKIFLRSPESICGPQFLCSLCVGKRSSCQVSSELFEHVWVERDFQPGLKCGGRDQVIASLEHGHRLLRDRALLLLETRRLDGRDGNRGRRGFRPSAGRSHPSAKPPSFLNARAISS